MPYVTHGIQGTKPIASTTKIRQAKVSLDHRYSEPSPFFLCEFRVNNIGILVPVVNADPHLSHHQLAIVRNPTIQPITYLAEGA